MSGHRTSVVTQGRPSKGQIRSETLSRFMSEQSGSKSGQLGPQQQQSRPRALSDVTVERGGVKVYGHIEPVLKH